MRRKLNEEKPPRSRRSRGLDRGRALSRELTQVVRIMREFHLLEPQLMLEGLRFEGELSSLRLER